MCSVLSAGARSWCARAGNLVNSQPISCEGAPKDTVGSCDAEKALWGTTGARRSGRSKRLLVLCRTLAPRVRAGILVLWAPGTEQRARDACRNGGANARQRLA